MAAIASGRLDRKTATRKAALTAPDCEHGETEYERLGDPVEDDSEHDRERRPGGLAAARRFSTGAAKAIDEGVSEEEHGGSGEEAQRDSAVAGGGLERLVNELEGDGADQHAGAEGHDQAERTTADREAKRNEAAEYERRARHDAPEEGLAHQLCISGSGSATTAGALSSAWRRRSITYTAPTRAVVTTPEITIDASGKSASAVLIQ